MSRAIYVSINPLATLKIINKTKNHEFRNYIPKRTFDTLYVYTTYPKSELRYLLEIEEITKYPNKIKISGDGNSEFNDGRKTKFAYKIKNVYELKNSLSLKELKEEYNFTPPQAYAYDDRYPELTERLKHCPKTRI